MMNPGGLSTPSDSMTTILARVSVHGVVQGVGFRPFVYQLASKYRLAGWVRNTSEDVKIEIEGSRESIEGFLTELKNNAPPIARIDGISHSYQPPAGYRTFEIRGSTRQEGKYQLVSPDIATCHRYPLRPAQHHHAAFHHVPPLPGGI
jgi:hydrogenase maturation protein HypF